MKKLNHSFKIIIVGFFLLMANSPMFAQDVPTQANEDNVNEGTAPAAEKIFGQIKGAWEFQEVTYDEVRVPEKLPPITSLLFTTEARFQMLTNDGVVTGSFRVNEANGRLYLDPDGEANPIEWDVELSPTRLSLSEPGAQGKEIHYHFMRVPVEKSKMRSGVKGLGGDNDN